MSQNTSELSVDSANGRSWWPCSFPRQGVLPGQKMSRIRAISELNRRELGANETEEGSWHAQYKDSPYIFVGSLPYELSEGDIRAIFSQYRWFCVELLTSRYGEVVETNLVREKDTGKSKGYAFIRYADYKSTILAVDNFNGISVQFYSVLMLTL